MAQMRPDGTPPVPPPPKQPNSRLRVGVLVGLLSLSLLFYFMPVITRLNGQPRLDIPYSQLKTEISSDNVTTMTLRGQDAQAELKAAITYKTSNPSAHVTSRVPDNLQSDPTFFKLLDDHKVVYTIQPVNDLGGLLINFLPFVALIAVWIWVLRRSGQAAQGIFTFSRSRARL